MLKDIIIDICNTAKLQLNVNAVGEGSIYELLNAGGAIERYANVIVTANNVTIAEDNYTLRVTIFYTDRLIRKGEEGDNHLDIQSDAIDTLHNILLTLSNEYDIDTENYTPFTQQFADNCAGAYVTVNITAPISGCEQIY